MEESLAVGDVFDEAGGMVYIGADGVNHKAVFEGDHFILELYEADLFVKVEHLNLVP